MKDKPRIVFYGTPEFAVGSLEAICREFPVVAVVTAPDKPAGRGLKLKMSPVKEFALFHEIPVLQPHNLKDQTFLDQLNAISPDLQVIVAFRMLPKAVWALPPSGTFNLHASLLPQYRGAAPINWVIINGEKETGVTTFFLDDAIDTGKILMSEVFSIGDHETAGELHDRLKNAGARLVLQTIKAIEKGEIQPVSQETLTSSASTLKSAPKIRKENCLINWNMKVSVIHNLIRGLSPHPGASAILMNAKGEPVQVKILRAEPRILKTITSPGDVVTNGKTIFSVAGEDGFLDITEIQVTGHKVMLIPDFLNGFGRQFV